MEGVAIEDGAAATCWNWLGVCVWSISYCDWRSEDSEEACECKEFEVRPNCCCGCWGDGEGDIGTLLACACLRASGGDVVDCDGKDGDRGCPGVTFRKLFR